MTNPYKPYDTTNRTPANLHTNFNWVSAQSKINYRCADKTETYES